MTHIEKLHYDAMVKQSTFLQKASESAQITQQIAIEFAEWASKWDWVFIFDRNVWVNDDMKIPVRSSKKLFAEFLKTKQ